MVAVDLRIPFYSGSDGRNTLLQASASWVGLPLTSSFLLEYSTLTSTRVLAAALVMSVSLSLQITYASSEVTMTAVSVVFSNVIRIIVVDCRRPSLSCRRCPHLERPAAPRHVRIICVPKPSEDAPLPAFFSVTFVQWLRSDSCHYWHSNRSLFTCFTY